MKGKYGATYQKREDERRVNGYYKNFAEKRRAYMKLYNEKLRAKIFVILGGKCKHCDFKDFRALQIDHVNGGGQKEKKGVTRHYYNFVLEKLAKGSKDYQALCANCNWIKRHMNGETRKVVH